ncbi:MAG: hypothetical protein J7L47_01115 [Candidatus Odinarchaeota archaeon]|nr:hypothetical protein [Candidatus Odinarchaeota archaeon]
MNDVITVRLPPELKREITKLKDKINWSEEIRNFIRKKVEEYKKREVIKEVVDYIERLPDALEGAIQKLVREDRDSH